MVELHQYRPFWGLPNASPFCMKAETYLRYRGIPYTVVPSAPRKSPSGMIPFVVEDGKAIPDSEAIIAHFEAHQTCHIDHGMTATEQSTAFFVRELVEERFYWQVVYMRWGDPAAWPVFKAELLKYLPRVMHGPILFMIRRHLLRQMAQRGLYPGDPKSAYAKGKRILDALSELLEGKNYCLGDLPRSLDMSVYAFLANVLDQPHSNPLQDHGKTLTNLVNYCARMKALCWKEWRENPVKAG